MGLSIKDVIEVEKAIARLPDINSDVMHKSFSHGKNFKIGRFCIIEKDCEVGDNVELMDYVKLMPGTKIGNNCKLDDYVNTSGYCEIGNNVRIKRCSMIGQATRIHDNAKVMSHVTTTRVRYPGQSEELWIEIEEGAIIGSHSVLLAGITIGKEALVGAGAVVTKDCEPGWVYAGNPAVKIKRRTIDDKGNIIERR